ncbi:MAG: prolyl oligopeptidase family serine peptidase [Halobacteriaceae archaeon]
MATDTAGPEYPLEEIASLPEFYHPRVAPDGERVAYYWDGSGRNELLVQNTRTGKRRQVTDGEVPRDARYPIAWHPDGERLFFHDDQGGDEQNDIRVLTVSDATTETVLETDGQTVLQDVRPDGDAILVASTHAGQLNLHELDLISDELTQLTTFEQPVRGGSYAPDGERIAFVSNESSDLENRDAYVLSVRGGDAEPERLEIGDHGAETRPVDWHPEGDRLLVADNSADLGRCGLYDLEGESVSWFGDGEYEEQPVMFTPDGDAFLALRNRDAAKAPIRYGLDGSFEAFDVPDGVASFGGTDPEDAFLADGRVLLAQTTPDTRQALSAYDLETGEADRLVEPEYGDIDPSTFVDAEYVTYDSVDGTEIGALLYRADGEGEAPVVVQVHGGPHGQSMKRFSAFTQFLVSRGYSVLQPNYRGSRGRGRTFKNAVHGDWGGKEQADIAAGARWLKEQDWVDPDRVAVAGGSYGGYSAYCQLTMYPDEWAAGVARVGITDLQALFEESMPHFKTTLREQMGDPEENAELWRERSPITHVDQITAPILIAHGVNDPRCPISQARLFRDALEERGWVEGEDFEYEELGEEGHGSTDIEQKIRAFELMATFFDDYL